MGKLLRAGAVLLDMDGTIVDSTAVVERLWLEWADRHGVAAEAVMAEVHGRQGPQSMAMLLPERDHRINIAENREMLERENAELTGVVAIPGAAELLARLGGRQHAVVTSAPTSLMTARMGAAGLTIPDVTVTAEDVAASKPDPEGFLSAAELLGVDRADCVVFEDSEAGIAAARAAGMRVIGVGAAAAAHRPDHAVADLTAVVAAQDGGGVTLTIG